MPAISTGAPFRKGLFWFARIYIAKGDRPAFKLSTIAAEDAAGAGERAKLLADLGAKLRTAGHSERVRAILERAAERDGQQLADVVALVDQLVRGELAPRARAAGGKWSATSTIGDLGEAWTSGELTRSYPDHIRKKKSADKDKQRFETHVYPLARDIPIAEFSLDDAETVMRAIPLERAPATRRHIAQVLHRLLGFAVFPMRLRATNPLPNGFLPMLGPKKAMGWLYPSEEAALMASTIVPLCWRIFYGFLARIGTRSSEASGLDVGNVNLELGAADLDDNKTNDPRPLPIAPDVAAALRAWLAHRARAANAKLPDDAAIFVDEKGKRFDGESAHLAERFRAHLKAAGVTRAALFERSDTRMQMRLHDLRATFVTLALANGQTETWVADRTGHKSSGQINGYRRTARTAAEMRLGWLAPLDQAIPELRAKGPSSGPGEVPPRSATRGESRRRLGRPAATKKRMIPNSSPGRSRTDKSVKTRDFKSPAFTVSPRGQVAESTYLFGLLLGALFGVRSRFRSRLNRLGQLRDRVDERP